MTIYESKDRNRLIHWDKVFPKLDKMSLIKVYISIVAGCTDTNLWYSNKETVAAIAWRWQLALSTVKVALTELCKLGFMKSQSRGIYLVNKEYIDD